MKLKKLLFNVISSIGCMYPGYSFGQQQISAFTELVYKRVYFIERLERSVEFLKCLPIDIEVLLEVNQDLHCFHHKTIKDSINKIIQLKSLHPIELAWEDFIAFKLLDDELYLDDFTKLILIISERILLHIIKRLPHKPLFDINSLFEKALSASYLERLAYIDLALEALSTLKIKTSFKKPILIVDHVKMGYTESVTNRFYYVHRLQKSVKKILCNKQDTALFFKHINHIISAVDEKISFSHEYINDAVKDMESERNLNSFENLWHAFEHYKCIEDVLFVREFSKLVFILHKNKIMNSYITHSKQVITDCTMQQLIDLYNKLDSLPLEELLNAIDVLTNEFPAINEKFEINSDMTWRQWLKKYWWAPPLIFGTFALKSLITVKNIKTVTDWISGTENDDFN